MMRNSTPAAIREQSGQTLEDLARAARITPAYLRRVEREGAGYSLALRLARIYGCRIEVFLHPQGGLTPAQRRGGRSRTSRP